MDSKRPRPLRYLMFDQRSSISKRSIVQRISQPVKQESRLCFTFKNLEIQVNPEKRLPESTPGSRIRYSLLRPRVTPFQVNLKQKELPLFRSSSPNKTFSHSTRQRRRGLSVKASTLIHLMK